MKRYILALSAAAMAMSAWAVPGKMTFSYNDGEDLLHYGTNKAETYDVAIKIQDPAYAGAQISGFSVKLPVGNEDVADLSGWLSNELLLEKKVNAPDICSVQAELNDSIFSVSFPTPYTVPIEGIYVGYSFKITNVNGEGYPKQPISVVEGSNPNALFIHSSRSRLKWTALSETLGYMSAMVVDLNYDFGPDDAVIAMPASTYVARGKVSTIPVTIVNHGAEPLAKISYSYKAGDLTGSGEYTFPSPLEKLGDSGVANLEIKEMPELGEFDITITVDTCNDKPNNDSFKTASGKLIVVPFLTTNRPLVEEYTGLGCQYCPVGYVSMEEMSEEHGDMFVGMAFHSQMYESGCMVIMPDSEFPFSVNGLPGGDINREIDVYPFYYKDYWDTYQSRFAPADVDVTLNWTDDSKTEFEAVANVKFAQSFENAGFKLAIALVADGLMNDAWGQVNGLRGRDDFGDSDAWKVFTEGPAKVYGLVFNDVVAYFKEPMGIEGSVPSEIEAGDVIEYSYRIKKDDVKNIYGEDFINDGATVHAVAILLDENGYSANCNKSNNVLFGNEVSVGGINSDITVESVEYYDLQGRRIQTPANGIFVKAEKLTDGTIRYTKRAVK